MSRYHQYQASFTGGEMDPLLRGRTDLQQYYAAVALAQNVQFEPQGGFSRRPGLRFLTDLTGDNPDNGVLLIPFEFSTTQNFMVVASVLTASSTIRFRFYANQTLLTNINGSGNSYLDYTVGTLYNVSAIDMDKTYFTQSADTLIITNENFAPFKILRGANNTTWTASALSLTTPKTAFTLATSSPSATLTATAVDGTTKVTAGSSVFSSSHVDQYINVLNGFGRARVIKFISGTVLEVVTEIPFFSTDAIASGDWELETGYENSWSNTRGWPRTCSFHEGRLYFGGAASEPSTLFASKVGDFFNFKIAEGLDDDALKVTLATDSVNAITALRSGRDLQIFTTGAEFFVPQADLNPVTPSNITIKSTTRRGSKFGIRPQAAEGGTIFIQRQGKAVREMLFSDVELSYVANNISLLNSHMLLDPQRMALRAATDTTEGDLLLIVNGTNTVGYRAASVAFSGTITAYTINRAQNIVAPANWSTDGDFIDVGVDLDTVFCVVKRTINGATKYYLEVFDDDRTTDSSIQYYSGAVAPDQPLPSATLIGGLSHLHAKTVKIVRDDIVDSDATVGTVAADDDGIVTQFVNSGETSFTLNGAFVSNGTASFSGIARQITFYNDNASAPGNPIPSAINLVLTITGTDIFNASQSETIALDDNAATYTGVKYFKTVTAVSINTAPTNFTLKVGVGAALGTITIGGTASSYVEAGLDYTVEVTTQPIESRLQSGSMQSTKRRVLEVSPILYRAQNITINGKNISLDPLPLPGSGGVTSFTGVKKTQGFLGFDRDAQITIGQSQPLFFTVLSLDYKLSAGQ